MRLKVLQFDGQTNDVEWNGADNGIISWFNGGAQVITDFDSGSWHAGWLTAAETFLTNYRSKQTNQPINRSSYSNRPFHNWPVGWNCRFFFSSCLEFLMIFTKHGRSGGDYGRFFFRLFLLAPVVSGFDAHFDSFDTESLAAANWWLCWLHVKRSIWH